MTAKKNPAIINMVTMSAAYPPNLYAKLSSIKRDLNYGTNVSK